MPVISSELDSGHHSAMRPDVENAPHAKTLLRRTCLAAGAAFVASATPVFANTFPAVRLGVLQFGTVQWIAEIIRTHGLDTANGFSLTTATLANSDAGRVALMADAADVVVSDWMFAAAQRAAGTKLCFAPFSSSLGGVMVAKSSPIQSLADLARRKLGVAGGPVDKSWLVVRAAAKASSGIDLTEAADVVYGAPPLLNAKLMQGELDAVLTYWNFAARLESADYRQIISVSDCAGRLGLPAAMCLVGFVFHQDWASRNSDALNGFLTAASAASALLRDSRVEWQQIRPLMNAPDEALFEQLKDRFIAGIAHPAAEAQERAAGQLLEVLLRTGGVRATDGLERLPEGIFWPTPASHG